jgi:hypothetical protein
MAFRTPETALEPENNEAMRWRFVCHYLVDLLPDDALPELCDRIKDIFEFYTPVNPSVPSLPSTQRVRARIGEAYERPAFHVAEE